jgi:hypothetical protein
VITFCICAVSTHFSSPNISRSSLLLLLQIDLLCSFSESICYVFFPNRFVLFFLQIDLFCNLVTRFVPFSKLFASEIKNEQDNLNVVELASEDEADADVEA